MQISNLASIKNNSIWHSPLLEASKHDILFGIKYSYYLVIAP